MTPSAPRATTWAERSLRGSKSRWMPSFPTLPCSAGSRRLPPTRGSAATPSPRSPPDWCGAAWPRALVLPATGEEPPKGLGDMAFAVPNDASGPALRELLRTAMENAAFKREVKQLHEQARRQHRQFEELNRIGIALSAERDIGKLQEFILMTMRQLTNADGASLWRKTMGEDGSPQLFLASSQNTSIDNTYQAFTVPVDDKSVVGYTVTVGLSHIYHHPYTPPPRTPQAANA